MALGREMHHRIRLIFREETLKRVRFDDIHRLVDVSAVPRDLGDRIRRCRIGHAVHIDNAMPGVPDQMPDDSGTNETTSTCQQYLHVYSLFRIIMFWLCDRNPKRPVGNVNHSQSTTEPPNSLTIL